MLGWSSISHRAGAVLGWFDDDSHLGDAKTAQASSWTCLTSSSPSSSLLLLFSQPFSFPLLFPLSSLVPFYLKMGVS